MLSVRERLALPSSTGPIRDQQLHKQFAPFAQKMGQAQLPALVSTVFRHYYAQLVQGATGFIPAAQAQPVAHLPTMAELGEQYASAGRATLNRTVLLKLNGGLGTGMGMQGPKSLLEAKAGLSFLEIIIRQVAQLRQQTGARLPLVLMNSFHTHQATLAALAAHPEFQQDVPMSFLQHKVPKVRADDFAPAVWPDDPDKEWCPPGHGDLYTALVTSNLLSELLAAGYEYAFISNADNLGAVLDEKILGYFAAEQLPFLMEAAHRTRADCKGGHLAQQPDGSLLLREIAQCPPDELADFQDIERYRYFNTNNLWLHLPALHHILNERRGVLGLPLIRNEKPVDPTDPQSYRVYQLETAMGSALAVFPGARAIAVPRTRFIPIKKNSDLLVLWSDAYQLNQEYQLVLAPNRQAAPLVSLDDRYYHLIEDLLVRFPHGAPSLLGCDELRVAGNIYFGRNVTVQGRVKLSHEDEAPYWVQDGSTLQGSEA